jgi:hypothetical protein
MYVSWRHILTLCAAVALALVSAPARAWVESEVRSHVATIDVDRAGRAIVTEDLSLAVRGGPLPGIELAGVDLDAEPLPDASVSSVAGSKADLPTTPVLLDKREDGTLRIEIDRPKGLRTGVYSFHFQYRTDLLKRGLIRRDGADVELRWVGPRFNQGIDSARVRFRVPAGPTPPTLPEAESTGRIDDNDALGGVFIGNLHRLADKDELEIVRPHIARGEPVVWRVRTSARAFDAFANPPPARAENSSAGRARLLGTVTQPRQRVSWWLGTLLLALAYAGTVAGKWRQFAALCRARGALPRALVPLPVGLRAATSGSLLGAALVSAAWFEQATLGALLLILAMALACQFAVPTKIALRGPGRWLALSDREAFARAEGALPGRYLDAGTRPGLMVFAVSCLLVASGAWLAFPRAPYQALLLLLGSACLLPVFFTGRLAQLPADLATRPRRLLASLAKRLRAADGLKVVPWARIPEGRREPDELRLLVQIPGAVRGLLGLEIGLEYRTGSAGPWAAPFVLIRAREGTLAASALPREVSWARGRNADERAAILRPRLPTQADCERLVLELVRLLGEAAPSPRKRANSRDAIVHGVTSRSVESPAHVL